MNDEIIKSGYISNIQIIGIPAVGELLTVSFTVEASKSPIDITWYSNEAASGSGYTYYITPYDRGNLIYAVITIVESGRRFKSDEVYVLKEDQQ